MIEERAENDNGDCLIVGLGYLGARVADVWLGQGRKVFATTRWAERSDELAGKGIAPVVWDVLAGGGPLPRVDTVLYCVGYDRSQAATMHEVYVEGLRRTLFSLPKPRLFLYASSTGVYGDAQGGWVDESTPPAPLDPAGETCLQAEQSLREFARANGWDAIVLRLAGLYGPGRMIGAEGIKSGQPVAADPDGYLNLIHVADAARVVDAARRLGNSGETYNVADGNPVKRRDFYRHAASLLKAPEPTYAQARRQRGDRRVSVERMNKTFRVPLQFPDYKAGLADALGDAVGDQ